MRPVKFRFWDSKNKKMLNTLLCPKNTDINSYQKFTEELGFELMQFTGPLDKNGKEIWESDIVVNSSNCDYKQVIKFGNGALGPDGMSFDECEGEHGVLIKNWEVVGNIYENPELLK